MMNKNVIKHRIPCTREQWLEQRLKGIGGSDAGALLGFNQYKSPYSLWCEKTGRVYKDVDNEAMRLGRDLEDYVAQRFAEDTGKKVRKNSFSYQSKEYPFMLANVDRFIQGEDAILECKTTSALTRTKYDKGDIPASYYAQCMHYLAVTGCKKAYIAVLVLGKNFYWFEIERNEEEIQALIESEKAFWECVTSDSEPNIDSSDSTSESLGMMYSDSNNNEPIEMFGMDETVHKYMDLCEQIKKLEKEKNQIRNELKHDLGECENGYVEGYMVQWKPYTTSSLDTEKLKKEHPEIYKTYSKESRSRRFNVKEVRNNDSN